MKSNLLYRGQDTAYAYVWMEFDNGMQLRDRRHRAARTPARRPGHPHGTSWPTAGSACDFSSAGRATTGHSTAAT